MPGLTVRNVFVLVVKLEISNNVDPFVSPSSVILFEYKISLPPGEVPTLTLYLNEL